MHKKYFQIYKLLFVRHVFWKVWFGIPQISKKDVDKNVAIKMVYF